MVRMIWGALLFSFSLTSVLYSQDIPDLYFDYKRQGDYQFQKGEYFYAFEKYRKAIDVFDSDPEIHYRLGRVYGLLEPQESFSDKEFALALNLYLRKYVDMSKINRQTMREFFGIPIDPYEEKKPTERNPIVFVKRDLDHDGEEEVFVLLRRGRLSYALFVLDYFDYKPRVHHLVTFYEGESGRADLEFKDLTNDGREEIIVVSEMQDFLNLFIFSKTPSYSYREVLNHSGLFLGRYMFVDVKGDGLKEIEVYEKLREGIVFDPNEGPFLMKKNVYMWSGERFNVVHSEPVYDEGYALNQFFGALLNDNDFERAFRQVHPQQFLNRLDRGDDLDAFIKYMRQPDYRLFLAETPTSGNILGQMRLREDLRYDDSQAWEEGSSGAPKSAMIRDDEKYYRLMVGGESYSVVLRRRGRWYIDQLKKESVPDGGWVLN